MSARLRSFQGAIDRLFDAVYVLSLPASLDRRSYIRQYFDEIGLTGYRFVDALAADSAEVRAAFSQGRVAGYPTCFRCKTLSCGSQTCNNVLIPPQVANFLSYRSLWQHIADHPQRALIVEDDVVFEPHAKDVLHHLSHAIETGDLAFAPDQPRLVRLGWAKSEEHGADTPFRLDTAVRMANPCHAMTSAYARVLVDRFENVETTSDIFVHIETPGPGEAVTVFPPIASEHSWSTGALDSLIHPKEIRSAFLREHGRNAEAARNDAQLARHVAHMHHCRFVVLSHPC